MTPKVATPEQLEKRKKFLLVLPLLILPVLALLFWKLGGGKGDTAQQSAGQQGINTELPSAQFKGEKPQNKLNLYDQAAKDSIRANQNNGNSLFAVLKKDSAGLGQNSAVNGQSAAASAERINKKLAQIRQQINTPVSSPPAYPPAYSPPMQPAVNPAEVDRLEKLMQSMKSGDNSTDPQMQQLDGMITKILQIQHPELVNQQLKQQQPKAKPDSLFKAIPAVIDGNQKVMQGGTVKLKLQDSVRLKGMLLAKGFNLYGNCMVTNQRLLLQVKSIRLGTSIIPVDLTVYYTDGLPGLPAPEAELAEAGGDGASNTLGSMEFLPMDQTLATQAAAGGIEAAKSLIGKKVRKIRVKLHNGEPVLLKINQP